jgi:AraC-like DNA-binding protein
LKKRDMVRPKIDKPRGVLNYRATEMPGRYGYWPSADLAPFVEHYWILEWDLPAPQTNQVLSHPSTHLALEAGRSGVYGVITKTFTRVTEGKGRVIGTKFRPGGFRPFVQTEISGFTDRRLSLSEVFGEEGGKLEQRVLQHRDHGAAIAVIETFLRGRHPQPDETIARVASMVERVAADRTLIRVEQLVELFGLGARQLQRLFSAWVGVSPKWVIQRYRLHEAAERVAASGPIDWAALALDLGYADQAHFIRDFKRLVGKTPAEYARAMKQGTSG